MKTKMIYFVVLWALIVLVQLSTYMLLDFTPILVAVFVTILGTGLTLYLGLKVERKRIERDERADKREPDYASQLWTINEHRRGQGLDTMILHHAIKPSERSTNTPSAHFKVTGDKIEPLISLPTYPRLFEDVDLIEDMTRIRVEFQPKITETVIITKNSHDLLDRNREALEAEENEPPITTDICKHCYRRIRGVIHMEGMNSGKMRCDPEDTMSAYGYNAEPTGSDCGVTCLGHS